MPSAEIITIGTELLLGQLVDTNTAVIAKALADVGMDVYRQASVGDNEARIAAAVHEALGRADAVICAGGLGPTVDDLTRPAVAAATGRQLVLHEPSLERIKEIFSRAGRRMTDNNVQQAMLPAGATALPNPNGTAPGFIVEVDGRAVVSLPGPPRELQPMLFGSAIPWLQRRFELRSVIVTRVLKTIGVPESTLDSRIADLFRESRNPSIAVLAHPNQVDVKLTAKAETRDKALELIAELEHGVRDRLGDCIFAVDSGTIEAAAGEALRARGWSIATAESCTGGMIGEMLTSVPGSSAYYRGSVVAYGDEVKTGVLGVDPELIRRHGAVSEEVASAMAAAVRKKFDTTLAVGVTGIAGPSGGTPTKPVGLVYIALAKPDGGSEVRRIGFPGDRALIRQRASMTALQLVWKAAKQ